MVSKSSWSAARWRPPLSTEQLAVLTHPITIALAFFVLASVLRFLFLGKWSFAFDEVFTLKELDSLFGRTNIDPDNPVYRLPRLLPVGYGVVEIGTRLFGVNEFGGRFGPALMSSLFVPVVFLVLDRLFTRSTAVVATLLLVLSPTDISYAQGTRFYASASVFGGLAILAGAYAADRSSVKALWISIAAAVAATLSHSVGVALLLLVPFAIAAQHFIEKRPLDRALVIPMAVAPVISVLLLLLHIYPIAKGWNAGATFGYSPTRAVLALVNQFGVLIFGLAATGLVLMFTDGVRTRVYWLACAAALLALPVVLPVLIVYQTGYSIPYTLPIYVAAGYAIATVFALAWQRSRIGALALAAVLSSTTLPGLASNYSDGSRADYRQAVAYVQSQYKPGDIVIGHPNLIPYYASPNIKSTALLIPQGFDKLAAEHERVWIVIDAGRRGIDANTQAWLLANTRLMQRFERPRMDYHRFFIEVYLWDAKSR